MRRAASVFIITLAVVGIVCVLGAFAPVRSVRVAATALDPTIIDNALQVTSEEYKLPATKDPLVESTVYTELWARVYRPASLDKSKTYPLLVFLHGNHSTCGRYAGAGPGRLDVSSLYSSTGTCPEGYVPVPSHEGYAYLAEKLASAGYIVVSINANRGVNASPGVSPSPRVIGDRGLNLRRGRLVLRHLMLLSEWNSGGGPVHPLKAVLKNRLDFAHVGLFGHSRGGEGMRAAYNYYREPGTGPNWPALIGPVTFEGIFEIGPVDGQQSWKPLNAPGTAWSVLLPMCDGDVYNLQGVKPFDRMMKNRDDAPATFKATYTVWGANHNFYNTEWQVSDSAGCLGHPRLFDHLLGSPAQRQTALYAVLAFFRGNVGSDANPAFNQLFDPQQELPDGLTAVTRVDRGYTDSPNETVTKVLDNFAAGTEANNVASGVAVSYGRIANHDTTQRVAQVSWNGPGPDTYFQSNAKSGPVPVADYKTLQFRVSRQCKDGACTQSSMGFPFDCDFSIRLVDGLGNLTPPVRLSNYISLTGPVGGLVTWIGTSYHPILQTVRIPISHFGSLPALGGVRFVFDQTTRDDIFIGNIELSTVGAPTEPVAPAGLDTTDSLLAQAAVADDVNIVKSIKKVPPSLATGGVQGVEIELTSNRVFDPKDELLVLRIGAREFDISRYPENGDIGTVIFALTADEFALLKAGDSMKVQYGTGDGHAGWNFGKLNKVVQ